MCGGRRRGGSVKLSDNVERAGGRMKQTTWPLSEWLARDMTVSTAALWAIELAL